MKYHGRNGKIEIAASISPAGSPLDGVDYVEIGSLSSFTLSFSRDKIDVTSFGDTNKEYLVGLKDVSGSFEGFLDSDFITTLYNAGDDADGVWIKITPSTDNPNIFFRGPAWLDLTVTGSVGDAVKVSGSIAANGTWDASLS